MNMWFDPDAWLEHRGLTRQDVDVPGDTVDTPGRLISTLNLREECSALVHTFEPRPSVIGVYEFIEIDDPRSSFLGGDVWMPEGETWPLDEDDNPMLNIGQLWLGDLSDYVPSGLPGLAIQLFAASSPRGMIDDFRHADPFLIRWLKQTDFDSGNWQRHPKNVKSAAPTRVHFYQTECYRTVELTAEHASDEGSLDFLDAAEQVFRWGGTKVGGWPVWIQTEDSDWPSEDCLICSFGSVYSITEETANQYLNEPKVSLERLRTMGGEPCWADMGLLQVFQRPDGTFYTTYEYR